VAKNRMLFSRCVDRREMLAFPRAVVARGWSGGYSAPMSSPSMSREEFADRVITIVRERFPLVTIEPASEGTFAVSVNGAVAPLENLYRVAVLHPPELKHQIERWAVELLRAAEGTPDQAAGYEEVKERILPMVVRSNVEEGAGEEPVGQEQAGEAAERSAGGSAGVAPSPGVISQPLVPGLMIAYAIDNDRTIAYISRVRFEQWGITLDQLHQTAIDNLVNRSESIAAHAAQDESGQVNLILFQTMDGYDASRILLPTLHDRLREHLGSPFAAGIPNRDILICFRDDAPTVARLRRQIAEDYRRMPHQVTDRLLLVTPDGIAPRQ
jgi:hypothetical protein